LERGSQFEEIEGDDQVLELLLLTRIKTIVPIITRAITTSKMITVKLRDLAWSGSGAGA
jgi:hypothetical protein